MATAQSRGSTEKQCHGIRAPGRLTENEKKQEQIQKLHEIVLKISQYGHPDGPKLGSVWPRRATEKRQKSDRKVFAVSVTFLSLGQARIQGIGAMKDVGLAQPRSKLPPQWVNQSLKRSHGETQKCQNQLGIGTFKP